MDTVINKIIKPRIKGHKSDTANIDAVANFQYIFSNLLITNKLITHLSNSINTHYTMINKIGTGKSGVMELNKSLNQKHDTATSSNRFQLNLSALTYKFSSTQVICKPCHEILGKSHSTV